MKDANPELADLARALKRCACFNVRSAARAVTGLYDKALEASGLRMTQLAILAVIRVHGTRTMQSLAQGHALWNQTQKSLREQLGAERFDRLVEDLADVTRLLR